MSLETINAALGFELSTQEKIKHQRRVILECNLQLRHLENLESYVESNGNSNMKVRIGFGNVKVLSIPVQRLIGNEKKYFIEMRNTADEFNKKFTEELVSETKDVKDPQLQSLAHMQELTNQIIGHLQQEEPIEREAKMSVEEFEKISELEDQRVEQQNQKHIERIHQLKSLIQQANLELSENHRDQIEKKYIRQDLENYNQELKERGGLIMVNATKEMLAEAFAEKHQISPSQIRFV